MKLFTAKCIIIDTAVKHLIIKVDTMDNKNPKLISADISEYESFVNAHPDVKYIDLILSDLNGVLRGKRLPVGNVQKVYSDALYLPLSVYGTDIEGDTISETNLGIRTGDRDFACKPLPGTLKVVPWGDGDIAQAQIQMVDGDDRVLDFCPRGVLLKIATNYKEAELTPCVAPELEFFLIDKERSAEGNIQPPRSPKTGEREANVQVYGIQELDHYSDFVNDVMKWSKALNVPADTAIAEYAPGQFEINLKHSTDVVATCDQSLMLKRIVKAAAESHGFEATFMAKPFIEHAGNGMHVHASIYKNDHNIFASNGDELGSNELKAAIGGLAQAFNEMVLICAPGANSYRRFSPDCYTPMYPSWGYNNRSVAMRIPIGSDNAKRVEFRLGGADANPYLVVATVLAAMKLGIDERLDPGPVTKLDAYKEFEANLVSSWIEAINVFERSTIMRKLLGEDFCRVYQIVKRAEYNKFEESITAREIDWYLRHA